MRLIDADDTMNQLRAYADRKHAAGHNELANGILKAVSCIRNNTVRVDAVEVVRCNWIPVSERLPKRGEFVLFAYAKDNRNPTMYAKNTMAVGRYDQKMFLVEGCSVKVTHWMPLPEPPKEESHET